MVDVIKPPRKEELSRANPPVMPMGFRVGITPEVMVLDFLDTPNAREANIFYSIVLTQDSAKNLQAYLADFLKKKEL